VPLFEVAIVHTDDDEKEILLFGPVALIALNAERAKMKAVRSLSEEEASDLDNTQVLVRPFAVLSTLSNGTQLEPSRSGQWQISS
jgi:hypothetical protein